MSKKPNKKNKYIELLLKTGDLWILKHPEDSTKSFPVFEKPLFKDGDKKRPGHINEAWWQEKHDMVVRYVSESMGYIKDNNYSKIDRTAYNKLVARSKEYIEYHKIKDGSAEDEKAE